MSLQVIEVALPSEVLAQIDAEVGKEHRSEYLAKLARAATERTAVVTSDPIGGDRQQKDSSDGLVNEARPSSRFRPISVKGEPVSATLIRDRGRL